MARSRLISNVSSKKKRRQGRARVAQGRLTLVHLDVDGAPPNVVLGGFLVDDALVLGTAASLLSGEIDQGTGRGDDGALVADGVLVQLRGGGVALQLDPVHVKTGLREILEIAADDCWDEIMRHGDTDVNAHVCWRTRCHMIEHSGGGGCGG